jgi:hypothetical protein
LIYLVVVLGLAALERDLGLLHERVDQVFAALVVLGGFAEGADGEFVVFLVELGLGFVEEAVEGVLIELQGFDAVFLGFLVVRLRGEVRYGKFKAEGGREGKKLTS